MNRDFLPVAFGLAITAVLSGTFVIAGLKAGITPGVSPLVILCAWGLFARRAKGAGGNRFLNLTQVSGSAGMAVTAGVIFTAPVIQILYAQKGLDVPKVDVWSLIVLSVAGSLIGFGFVGLATKKFLSDPSLPAPEARACDTMIRSAVAEREARPLMGRSLFAALGAGALATLATKMGALAGAFPVFTRERNGHAFAFRLPLDAMLIGIGGLLTLGTALLVFGGALLRMIGEYVLAGLDPASVWRTERFLTTADGSFDQTLRWAGGATMLVAVVYSLVKFLGLQKLEQAALDAEEERVLSVDAGLRRALSGTIGVGVLILVAWLVWAAGAGVFSVTMAITVLVMAMLMTTLGAILSLQIGSSASPVSGTIFVTTLALCVAALAVGHTQVDDVLILTPLMVGACVAVCAANDSSQDYKTMQLGGVRVQDGFLAQLLGLVVGSVVVPVVLMIAHESWGLQSLPAPQGKMFATLINGLLLEQNLPWWPIGIGAVLGVLAVLMEIVAHKRGHVLPAMALAVGLYLPAALGSGILIGALFRFAGEYRHKQQTNESILTAAGLITGSALLELVLGVCILFGYKEENLETWHDPASWTALVGIVGLGLLVYLNSRRSTR